MNAARSLVPVLLALAAAACGGRPEPEAVDPWPLTLRDATVLGYAVVCVPADQRDGLLRDAVAWAPAGLADDRPMGFVRFDTSTFGGPAALVLPVDDGDAFLASLSDCPGVETLGDGRFVFRPPPSSGLGMLLVLASGWQARSPLEALASLGEASGLEYRMEVRLEDGHAFVVPSFEALSVCRAFLDDVGGLRDARPTEALLSVDVDQVRIVYAEALRSLEGQLKALASGAQFAGPLAMLGGRGFPANDEPVFPVDWDLVWALREMLDARAVAAVQLRAAAGPGARPEGGPSLRELLRSFRNVGVRVAAAPDAAWAPVLASLRPVPADLDALVLLAADPARFAPAFAAWCRPLAEFVKGEGAPAERHLERLAGLLAGWDGLLGVFEVPDGPSPVVLATVGQAGLDLEDAAAWCAPLLEAFGAKDVPAEGRVEELDDGRRRLVDAEGRPVLTTGRRGPVQWFVPGDGTGPPAELLIRFAGARGADAGPALRCEFRGASLALHQDGDETRLDLTLPGAD